MNFCLVNLAFIVVSSSWMFFCGCKTELVTRSELEKIIACHSTETINCLWYRGSKDSTDFIVHVTTLRTKGYALPFGELVITNRFPYTDSRDKWRLLKGNSCPLTDFDHVGREDVTFPFSIYGNFKITEDGKFTERHND